jgi:hypothetical protein
LCGGAHGDNGKRQGLPLTWQGAPIKAKEVSIMQCGVRCVVGCMVILVRGREHKPVIKAKELDHGQAWFAPTTCI